MEDLVAFLSLVERSTTLKTLQTAPYATFYMEFLNLIEYFTGMRIDIHVEDFFNVILDLDFRSWRLVHISLFLHKRFLDVH